MPLKREIIQTEDGSVTIFIPELNECYHSIHGAVNESNHIFIEAGLKFVLKNQTSINILEVGFGTGLNAFLTAVNCRDLAYTIYYIGVEPFPLVIEEIEKLNYAEVCGNKENADYLKKIHLLPWEEQGWIGDNFSLLKRKKKIEEASLPDNVFDLVYFDAFAPSVQPELWKQSIFEKLFNSMKSGGVLVTYSSKGDVKRALKACGFQIEKLPGPKGKREFCRGVKTI